jgi:dTDP-4-amino-4,6-dideoxygalactose transaminase
MRESVRDLAIAGAPPAFQSPLHVGRPNIGNRDRLMERISDMLDRRWFSNAGVYVSEFERRLADMLDVEHCIVMCNGTVALEIAIRALGLEGEVIIPSLTFIATAHALQWQQIKPVFCDIDPTSCTIDSARIEELITPQTTGIIGVHLWGRPCDTDAIQRIADSHGLRVLYDAAHALGVTSGGKMVGGFGDAEVFSFHATKFVNSFEGGAVTTNNAELAERIRLMKNFGFSGYDNVVYIGTNGKMPEVSAAMGLTSLESIEDFIAINHGNYLAYQEGIATIPGLRLLPYTDGERTNYQYIVLCLDEEVAGIRRDGLIEVLHRENVMARRYFYPGCHRMEPYRSQQPEAGLVLPETEKLVGQTIVLPTGTGVGQQEILEIVDILRCAIGNANALSEYLGPTG